MLRYLGGERDGVALRVVAADDLDQLLAVDDRGALLDLKLGHEAGREALLVRHLAVLGAHVEHVQLDQTELSLLVTVTAITLAHKLREAAVQRLLSTLESSPRRAAGAGLLTTHAEPAGGALARRDTAPLPGPAPLRTRRRLEVAKDATGRAREELAEGRVRLEGVAALPVEHLHVEGRQAHRGHARAGGHRRDARGGTGAKESRSRVHRHEGRGRRQAGGAQQRRSKHVSRGKWPPEQICTGNFFRYKVDAPVPNYNWFKAHLADTFRMAKSGCTDDFHEEKGGQSTNEGRDPQTRGSGLTA